MICLSFAFQTRDQLSALAKKFDAQCLPIAQVLDQPVVFAYGTVVKLSQYTGHVPVDWTQLKTGEIACTKVTDAKIRKLMTTTAVVSKGQNFVEQLMNDVKNEGVLQPVLARTCVMPLSQQRNVRDYIYRWIAGEHKKCPTCFPDLNTYLDDNVTEFRALVKSILNGKVSYKTAVHNGANGYELRYVLKGLASIGKIDGTKLNKMFGV